MASIEIDNCNVGKIIGPKGATIRQLQDQYRVRISIAKDDNTNGKRVTEITGDGQDVQNAIRAIQERFQPGGVSNHGAKRSFPAQNPQEDDEWDNAPTKSGNTQAKDDWDGGIIEQASSIYPRDSPEYIPPKSNNFNNRNDSGSTYSDNNRIAYRSFDDPPPTEQKEFEPIDWDAANKEAENARKARWAKCPKMLKNFYIEHPEVTNMSEEEAARFRTENKNIVITRTFSEEDTKEEMPKPTTKFEHAFEKFPDLLAEIKKAGFEKPSPIQSQMWPVLMRGEDCIGIAQTGTGKTLAFLLPALIHTDGQPHARGIKARGGPNVLVLAPTRELAIQIEKEVGKYQFRGIRAVCLYGGNDRKKQIEVVESGVEIIIATPGRLNDLVAAGYIKIESVTYLILDEADRMLDMGFEPQIRKLLIDIRDDRQTVMTSATWPSGVRRLAASYMNNPYQVCIGSLDLAATHTVTQVIEIMEPEAKFSRILRFARDEMTKEDKAIIFVGRKDAADALSCDFALKGLQCQCIHGNRDQSDREQALADIKSGDVRILIATDVASRGIDIEDITYVVNYDFPRNIEEYVHRVGRTGRANRRGISLSFMTKADWGSAAELIDILKEAEQEIPQELQNMAERFAAKKERMKNERGGFRGGPRGGGGRGGFGGGFGGRDGGFGGRDGGGGFGGRRGGRW